MKMKMYGIVIKLDANSKIHQTEYRNAKSAQAAVDKCRNYLNRLKEVWPEPEKITIMAVFEIKEVGGWKYEDD